MKINYSTSIAPIVAETVVSPCSASESILFVYKEDGYIDYKLTINKDIDVEARCEIIKQTSKRYTLKTNTTNVIASDKVQDGTVYFYKVFILGSSVDLKDLLLSSTFDIIYKDKEYYTNSLITNYEIVSGVYIYSKPVIDNTAFSYLIDGKDIILTLDRRTSSELYFKPKYKLCIEPNYVSDSRIHFDSFSYTRDRVKNIAVEGDILLVNKREYNSDIGNSIKCKDLIVNCDSFYTNTYNKIYKDTFNYTRNEKPIIEYLAKRSNHVFDIKDELHFKLEDSQFYKCDKEDSDFTVTKVIDYSKIHIEMNEYLDKYSNILPEKEYIFSNSNIEDNSKVGLKDLITTSLRKFPSEKYYIKQDNAVVYQHTNKLLSDVFIPTVSLNTDSIKHPMNENIYNDFNSIKVKTTTYYKKRIPYKRTMITEDYKDLLTEEDNNFTLG